MACYEDLIKLIREKHIEDSEVDSLAVWALTSLSTSNNRMYTEIMAKYEQLAYSISPEQAEEIVRGMKPKGRMWTYDQVKSYINTKGIQENCWDWFLVMNMMYNDYYNTAKLFGHANDTDYYFSMAKDFIEDVDAPPYKVAKYFSE